MELNVKHFFNRATFGVSPATIHTASKANIKNLFRESGRVKMIHVIDSIHKSSKPADPEERKEIKKTIKENLILLNTTWLNQMREFPVTICEKMVLFWHDHFACRTRNPYLAQQQNNTIRKHALGKFSDLLLAVSKDPAMLQFLNNQQNKKDNANENFAREVMELFTLGRGKYTEEDIKDAARAFTGWAFNPATGDFIFRDRVHDQGIKTFRGKKGNFSGEDIISMILEDRNTAKFITLKIWSYLVHTEIMDRSIIEDLSESFYTSGYDITKLLENIFTSNWFYDNRYIGNRIKSPIDLIIGLMVQTAGTFNNTADLVFLQKALGQVLLHPPNVGGWPVGKEWIDSSSLVFRMSLPSVLFQASETEFQAKDDGDVNNITNTYGKARKISLQVNWKTLSDRFVRETSIATIETIEHFLLAKPTSMANRKSVYTHVENSYEDTDFVKKAFIAFMSLPEYQLS